MDKLPLLLVPLLTAGSLLAQGGVVPPWMANSPGSGSTNYPFGLRLPNRVQYVYDAATTGMTVPNLFTAFAARSEQGSTNAAKANIDLQIEMSQTPTTRATMSTTFATNRGANHAVVYARRLTSLPATTPAVVGAWTPPFVLDTPFVYDPTGGDSLLVEFDVASLPSGPWPVDTAWTAPGVHFAIGTGCNGMDASSSGGSTGGRLTVSTSGAPANAPGAMLFGFTEYPVPIPIPGNPACSVYAAIAASATITTDPSGAASYSLNVPASPGLKGGSIYGQFAAVDATSRINTSPARRVFLTGTDECGRIYDTSSNTSLTGQVQAYVGPVLRIQ